MMYKFNQYPDVNIFNLLRDWKKKLSLDKFCVMFGEVGSIRPSGFIQPFNYLIQKITCPRLWTVFAEGIFCNARVKALCELVFPVVGDEVPQELCKKQGVPWYQLKYGLKC